MLLARSLGVDARIAIGYQVDRAPGSGSVTTADASAWPEVRTSTGWAAVDLLPADTKSPESSQESAGRPETPPAQQPQLPPQVEPADTKDPVEAPLLPAQPGRWSAVRIWALRGGLFTGLLLWPLVVFSMVVTWKKLRRRKGLKAPDPARRVTTAWTLATDALVDAGATLQPSHTNAELVEAGVKTQPAAGPPLGRLQRHADAVTFAICLVRPAAGGRCSGSIAHGRVQHPQFVVEMVAVEVVAQHPLVASPHAVAAALTARRNPRPG